MKKFMFLLLVFLLPFDVFAEELIPGAFSGILIEAGSGKIIYEKNIDDEHSVASMTKMVAQIIILEQIEKGKIHWDDMVSITRNASSMGGSQIYLAEGEKMSVEDLMKGISVASGNDATVAMAEYIAGSEDKFVLMMNKKVKELGLKHTHFVNSTGLDVDGHYSSSYDMAIIARDLVMNHSEIIRFSSIYEDYLRKDTDRKFWLVNTNKLISQYEGVDGLKTGHTDNAGYCLAATAKRGDLRLIAIVLGEGDSKVRNSETIDLLDYGFNNVKLRKLKDKGSIVRTIKLEKADINYVNVILRENLNVLEEINDDNRYSYKVKINPVKLPMKKNTVVGKISAFLDKKEISSTELVIDRDIIKTRLFDLFKKNIFNTIYGVF